MTYFNILDEIIDKSSTWEIFIVTLAFILVCVLIILLKNGSN